ncbi:MAG TPA: hypothetical protein VGH95_00905 [Candidatus Aquirickettsiella sp.]
MQKEYITILTNNLRKIVTNILTNSDQDLIKFLKKYCPFVYAELGKEIKQDEASSTISNLGIEFLFYVIHASVTEDLDNNCTFLKENTVQMSNWESHADSCLARNRILSQREIFDEHCNSTWIFDEENWISDNNNKIFYDNWINGVYAPIEDNANMRSSRWEYAVDSALSFRDSIQGINQEEKWDQFIQKYLANGSRKGINQEKKWYQFIPKYLANGSRKKNDSVTIIGDEAAKDIFSVRQLTQMGEAGLFYFFQFCRVDYPGPSDYKFKRNPEGTLELLDSFFDLRGSRCQRTPYADCLVKQLKAFHKKEKNPLFKSLRLILPDSDNENQAESIIELYRLINEYHYPALLAVKLYNFDPDNDFHHELLNKFYQCAEKSRYKVQIILPELDDLKDHAWKKLNRHDTYKALQNLVLENRREDYPAKPLSIGKSASILPEGNSDPNVIWPLHNTNSKLAINVQQQQQQQQSKLQEYQADNYHQESDFITRDNIEENYRNRWKSLSEEIKKSSGHTEINNLSGLFDRWVNSINIAGESIQWMEPEAVQTLMDYAPQFRFGLPSQDSLPAGFSIKKHRREGGLILCCDSLKQKPLDIQKRKEIDKEKRNPFSVKLKEKMTTVPWQEGDFRQLSGLNEDNAQSLVLWNALATTRDLLDVEKKSIEDFFEQRESLHLKKGGSACHSFSTDKTQNSLLQIQSYVVSAELITSKPESACELLKNWAKAYTKGSESVFNFEFLEYLFNEETFSPENLKALGQLFYQQGIGQLPKLPEQFASGILAFIYLSQSIFTTVAENNFKIWKRSFVDPSCNLSELVRKNQLRAVEDCLATLQQQEYKSLQDIWWKFVDKQAQTAPYNQFSCLWKAFKSLAYYLNNHHLILNTKIIDSFLKKSVDFQLPIFVERLILALEKFNDNPSKQQKIIDNLDKYNWHNKIPYNDYSPDEVIVNEIEKSLFKKTYRVLNEDEVQSCILLIKSKLSEVNASYNTELLVDFFKTQLAVPREAKAKQIQQLLLEFEKLFLCLNKTQYSNDLTQLMLVLKGAGEKSAVQQYAAPYLLFVLRAYLPSKEKRGNEPSFYPTLELNDYLAHELGNKQSSSLLLDANLKCQLIDKTKIEGIESYLSEIKQLDLAQSQKIQLITFILASAANLAKFKPLFSLLKKNRQNLLGNQFFCTLALFACKQYAKNSEINQVVLLLEKLYSVSQLFKEKRPSLMQGLDRWEGYQKVTSAYQANLHHLYEHSLCSQNPQKFWEDFSSVLKEKCQVGEIVGYLAKLVIVFTLLKHTVGQGWLTKYNTLQQRLDKFELETIKKLAEYVIDHSYRSEQFYLFLLNSKENNLDAIIHKFESGQGGRSYTEDSGKINSIFAGFKQKGVNGLSHEQQKELSKLFIETNSYSKQEKLDNSSLEDLKDLRKLIHHRIYEQGLTEELQINPENNTNKAHLLAVMREILFRKTGKWLNSTQLCVCLYSAINSENDNRLYQVKTGEGKSILMAMRAAFLALSGKAVDILSSKESLVQRDHLEFSAAFAAMGLSSRYVNQYSSSKDYLPKVQGRKYGDINYATVSGLTLFRARCEWEKSSPIYKTIYTQVHGRIALLDEADHILLDENTQFNYSVCDNNNEETWVYQIISQYYDKHKEEFKQRGISQELHLKLLLQEIMNEYPNSPKQSNFVTLHHLKQPTQETYIELKELLCAVHRAAHLRKDIDFCIATIKQEWQGKTVTSRVANVLINNQVQEGAIYSNGVQQFLHLRLNKQALAIKEVPNFSITPETQLAVSQNVQQVLTQHYSQLEGFTGTAGDQKERVYLKKTFNFESVIKIPSDKPSQSKQHETIFADNEAQQISTIYAAILASRDQPILILCRDDREAKKIHSKIIEQLKQNQNPKIINNIILDSNAQSENESNLLAKAGSVGSVTLSSRMGRGTDIKPQTDKGLKLIRTYLASKRITKQEYGRQGRNGQVGLYQDILDGSFIENNYKTLIELYPELVRDIYQETEKKLKRHRPNQRNFSKILQSRVVMECQDVLKSRSECIQRIKNNFVAMLSTECHKNLANVDSNDRYAEDSARETQYGMDYRARIIKFHKGVDMAWGGTGEDKYELFVEQVKRLWENIFPDCSFPNIPIEIPELLEIMPSTIRKIGDKEGVSGAIQTSEEASNSINQLSEINNSRDNLECLDERKEITNILQMDEEIKESITKLAKYEEKLKNHSSSLAKAKVNSLFKLITECNKPKTQVDNVIKIIDEERETLRKHRHPSVFNCYFSLFFKPSTLEKRVTSLKLVNELSEILLKKARRN